MLSSGGFSSNRSIAFGIGLLGVLGTFFFGALSIIFYFRALREPDLVYTVHPVRTLIVQRERPAQLRVQYEGEIIDNGDVAVVRIAIWNRGRGSIRPENILSPIQIKLGEGARVLEAGIVGPSRDVTHLEVSADRTSLERGIVPLSWAIMERADGAVLQIIYVGQEDVEVKVEGVVERQGAPRNLRSHVKPLPSAEQYRKLVSEEKWDVPFMVVLNFLVGVAMVALHCRDRLKGGLDRGRRDRSFLIRHYPLIVGLGLILLSCVAGVSSLSRLGARPPFEF